MRSHAKAATAGSTKRLGRSKPALLLCVLAASVAALALVVGSASGATTRFLVEVFGSSAQPTFPADRGMAFDQGSSQLYVIDSTNDTISRFNADGTAADFGALGSNVIDGEGTGDETPLGHLAFEANRQREQLAIDESGGATDGNIYATRAASDVVDVFASTGEYKGTLSESTGTGAFGEPCGVAVDSSGNVYVGDRGDDRIHVYEPAGAVPVNADNTASFATVTDPCTLAAGAGATAGFLFVNASTGAQLRKVDAATGEVKYEIATGGSTVSVDPATGHVFVARNTGSSSQVDEYDASGAGAATLVSSFKPGSTVEGIALNSGAEQVYVARSGTESVEVFGPAAVIPDVVTEAPSSNTGTRATLAGTVNPDGVELDECFFEWGPNPSNGPTVYGNIAPCAETPAEIGAGTAPVAVHADLNGLIPQGTNYHYRLVAENPNGTVNGSNQNFTTPDTVVTGAATGITPTEATLNGTVNPDGTALTECLFEWGPEKEFPEATQSYPESTPCVPGPGGIGSGASPVAVKAELIDLHPGTPYAYRLKAVNPGGPILGGEEISQTAGPAIAATWAKSVVRTEATLKAEINPEGSVTTYHFEYGTTEAYGSETPETTVGSDSSVHTMTAFLDDLKAGTVYHYRAVATNGVAVNEGPNRTITTYLPPEPDTDCPNQAFRGGASTGLPDCRAYEMVSPLDKGGGDIAGTYAVISAYWAAFEQASLSGEKVTFSSGIAFGDQLGNVNSNQYLATRGPSGWSTEGINPPIGPKVFDLGFSPLPPNEYYFDNQFQVFSEDLSSAWVINGNKAPITSEASEGFGNLYRRDNLTGAFEALTINPATAHPAGNDGIGLELEAKGASADGTHQVFDAHAALTPETSSSARQVYDFSDGELHLVSVLPTGVAATGTSSTGTNFQAGGTTSNSRRSNVKGAISSDGSRIFWSRDAGPLYVRENPGEEQSALAGGECTEVAKACTTQLSPGLGEAHFWAADPGGSRALFGQWGSGVEDLYKVDVDSGALTLLAGRVRGVLGTAADLSRVYFVSDEELAPGAVDGAQNLYLDHEGVLTFIADIDASDGLKSKIVALVPLLRDSKVTPDGRHVAFMSDSRTLSEAVAGYDNTDAQSGELNSEVYLYDADSDQLICASCNPSGARPHGGIAHLPHTAEKSQKTSYSVAARLTPPEHETHQPRAIAEGGDRLFFESLDPLVPHDRNGVQDVYQWEAPGTGSCDEADPAFSVLNEGCIDLISSGESTTEVEFVDADASGEDVFFRTKRSINPRDPGSLDIYDARAGGGYPPPPILPECLGDTCQTPPEAPRDPTPASAGFRGVGDPAPRRNCGIQARRAVKFSRRAKLLRRRMKKASSPKQTKALRKRSTRFARQAKRLSTSTERCRRANRRASR